MRERERDRDRGRERKGVKEKCKEKASEISKVRSESERKTAGRHIDREGETH